MSLRIVLAMLAPLAACDSQVDSDHQGDALAKIGGSVRNTRSLPIAEGSEIVVVWQNSSGTPDLTGADSVEVQGSFPAQFTLSIYEPPAANLLNDFNGVKVGVAYIIAGVPGTDFSNEDEIEGGLLGMEENHLLVYVPDGVPADSDAAFLLRTGLAPGFHLFGVHKLTDEESQTRQDCVDTLSDPTIEAVYTECGGHPNFDDFVPLETDLATPLDIELIDDPSTIDAPNWT
jgi:hypothetical protein